MMESRTEHYREFLVGLVALQQQLVQAFEERVRVVPPDVTFPRELQDHFESSTSKGRQIAQILADWPQDVTMFPVYAWVEPKKGVVQVQGRNWLFQMHGSSQISFIGLPSGLDAGILERLRRGDISVLKGIRMEGGGPTVEVECLVGGRTDGVSAWTMYVFAEGGNDLPDWVGAMRKPDHQRFLEEMVNQGFLCAWRPYYGGGNHYVIKVEE